MTRILLKIFAVCAFSALGFGQGQVFPPTGGTSSGNVTCTAPTVVGDLLNFTNTLGTGCAGSGINVNGTVTTFPGNIIVPGSLSTGASPPNTTVCGTNPIDCFAETASGPNGTNLGVGQPYFDTSHFFHIGQNNVDYYAIRATALPGAGLGRFPGSTSTVTSSEISGDCTTSGSNAITCTKTSGTAFTALATTTPASNVAAFLAAPSGANFNAMITGGGVPVVPNSHSANYTTVIGDCNSGLLHPTADNNARTFTIDSNANVACPVGSIMLIDNQINTLTLAITSDTLQLGGSATTGSRTIAANCSVTVRKLATTLWVVNGGSCLT